MNVKAIMVAVVLSMAGSGLCVAQESVSALAGLKSSAGEIETVLPAPAPKLAENGRVSESFAAQAAALLRADLHSFGIPAKVKVATDPEMGRVLMVEFKDIKDYLEIKDMFYQDEGMDGPIYRGIRVVPWVRTDAGDTTRAGLSYPIGHTEEQAAFGSLSRVRSALQVYYGDHEGVFPGRLEELATPEYLHALPEIKLPGQVQSNKVINVFKVENGKTVCDLVTKEGGYLYIADKSVKDLYGSLVLNSSAKDLKGKAKYCEY